jgi:hypothetical protein
MSSGYGRVHDLAHGRPGYLDDVLHDAVQVLEVPVRDVGERQEPERVGRRGGVHDDDVVPAVLVELLDMEQRGHELHAREDRHLLRRDAVHALRGEEVGEVTLYLLPTGLELVLDVHLEAVEVLPNVRYPPR